MTSRTLLLLPLVLALGCPPPDENKPEDDTGLPTGCTDADGDGYCEEVDCDDQDAAVNPGVDEESMGPDDIDNDCDGAVDECSEDDPSITWHAEEICDGIDNDCDGSIDEDLGETWYPDVDGDGYGDPLRPQEECDPGAGLVRDGSDCDDGDPGVNPGAMEVCDGVDNDCDATTIEDGSISVDGVGGFASVQAALDAAEEGATVLVCAGVWPEHLSIARSVTLEAPAGAEATELTGEGEGSIIHISDGIVTVRGFTIRGGQGTDISSESEDTGGGGILAWNADELLVDGCVITENQADYGGGILGPSEGLLTVEATTVSDNHASTSGGGIYVMEGVLEDVVVEGNSSSSSGGGLYHYENALLMIGCSVTDNLAGYGGGMRAYNDSVDAEDTLFEGNVADYGGGVYMRNDSVIAGLELRGNSADRGAGVYCREDCTLSDSVMVGNEATSYGGGIMCRDGAALFSRLSIEESTAVGGAGILQDSCDTLLEEVSVTGGSAVYGGGLYLVESQFEAGADVLIEGNVAESAGGGAYLHSNSAWDGGTVRGNSGGSGGGLYLYGLAVVEGVTIQGNDATEWGGGLLVASDSDLADLVVDGNTANYGAGLYIYSDGEVWLDSSTVTANAAVERGGGVRVSAGILSITAVDLGEDKADNTPDDVYAGGTAYTDLGVVESLSCSGSEGCG